MTPEIEEYRKEKNKNKEVDKLNARLTVLGSQFEKNRKRRINERKRGK